MWGDIDILHATVLNLRLDLICMQDVWEGNGCLTCKVLDFSHVLCSWATPQLPLKSKEGLKFKKGSVQTLGCNSSVMKFTEHGVLTPLLGRQL